MTTQYATTPQTDNPLAETVYAAKRGDRQAFGRLIENFERAVYATAYRRLNNHAEAQELCQDVFLQAMRKIDQLDDPRCFGGWLRSIADRMAINRMMPARTNYVGRYRPFEIRLRRTSHAVGGLALQGTGRPGPPRTARLRALDRDTLVAFYFDGRSINEMSKNFETPVGTIKRRLHVARKRLAKELESLTPA